MPSIFGPQLPDDGIEDVRSSPLSLTSDSTYLTFDISTTLIYAKSLSSRRHHSQLKETAGLSRKEIRISLDNVTNIIGAAVNYESSAESLDKPFQGVYGSQTSLVPGIQKTTRVDVSRSDDLVARDA